MPAFVRKIICEKIAHLIKPNNVYYELEVPTKKISLAYNGKPVLHWSPMSNTAKDQEILKALKYAKYDEDIVENVHIIPSNGRENSKVEFVLHSNPYLNSILCTDRQRLPDRTDHLVFEYSSPNIAKPFHVGHLRSTIIGNVLANLHQELGYKVTKINYLGDWGTQFGMLQVGVEMLQITEEQVKKSPIETLNKAYVKANLAAVDDPTIMEKARQYFNILENDTDEVTSIAKQWKQYRLYTIKELEMVYKRLGIQFDFYDWESQYSQKHMSTVLQKLTEEKLLSFDTEGRQIIKVDKHIVPIMKSDGSTLYLARDLAALLDRWQRFAFVKIFYVVENGQSDHFNSCFKTISQICPDISESKLKHVKFGRIHGMSSRKGGAVILKDLLDEANERMHYKQLNSPNTKIQITDNNCQIANQITDMLGVTSVIVNDLKQRRQRNYEFSWEKALQMNGDTGIKLQYTHCRLYNLLQNSIHLLSEDINPSLNYLNEPEALDLLYEISRYTQIIWQSTQNLEACILVNYLFSLCNATSRALKRLPVKNESNRLKQINRIKLFQSAKAVLKQGLEILGLKPLNKM